MEAFVAAKGVGDETSVGVCVGVAEPVADAVADLGAEADALALAVPFAVPLVAFGPCSLRSDRGKGSRSKRRRAVAFITGEADCVPDAELEVVREAEADGEAVAEGEAAAVADDAALADVLASNDGRALALALEAREAVAVCAMLALDVSVSLGEGRATGAIVALGAKARKVVVLSARQGSLLKAKLASAGSDTTSTKSMCGGAATSCATTVTGAFGL